MQDSDLQVDNGSLQVWFWRVTASENLDRSLQGFGPGPGGHDIWNREPRCRNKVFIWNLATPYIEGYFDIEAFEIEGCFDIEYSTSASIISKYLLRYRS